MAIYKKDQFKAFIKALKYGSVAHWMDIARALNVDDDTIKAWRDLPEAQLAIQEGIDEAFRRMQESGAKDWRMWESKLKMLGVNPAQKVEVINDPRLDILGKYMGEGDAGKVQKA